MRCVERKWRNRNSNGVMRVKFCLQWCVKREFFFTCSSCVFFLYIHHVFCLKMLLLFLNVPPLCSILSQTYCSIGLMNFSSRDLKCTLMLAVVSMHTQICLVCAPFALIVSPVV